MKHLIATLTLTLTLAASSALAFQPGEVLPSTILAQLGASPSKITVVDFFAEWCESCRKELPLISALNSRSNKSQVEFIGIDSDDDIRAGQAFQKVMQDKGGLNFRVIDDPQQALVKAFKPRGFPALYIIQDGKLVKEHLGATPNIDVLVQQDLNVLTSPNLASQDPKIPNQGN